MDLFLLCVFGLGGVLSRHFLNVFASRGDASAFPVTTFAINIAGAFLIGVCYVFGLEKGLIPENLRIAIMTGFLGGFTTFSAFTLESSQLFEKSQSFMGLSYLVLSPILGLAATFLGLIVARRF